MAHELDMSNGKANMAYVGEIPWHGLGQELTADAPLEVWKKEAGMDWNIETSQVQFTAGYLPHAIPNVLEFPGKTVLYRSDTKAPLSIVSGKYQLVQPDEVMEFFRDLTEDLGMKLTTAGCLFDGKKFWALADTGMAGKVLGNDAIKGFLLLTSSCDGTSPTIAQFTSIRVVCNNTLQFAMNGSTTGRAAVRHSTKFSPMEIKQNLGLAHDSWDSFMKSITTLSERSMSDDAAKEFFTKVLAKNEKEIEEMPNALGRKIDKVIELYNSGMGAEIAKGTQWGALNAITEFSDHHSGGRVGDTMLWNSWYGSNADMKNKAFELLTA